MELSIDGAKREVAGRAALERALAGPGPEEFVVLTAADGRFAQAGRTSRGFLAEARDEETKEHLRSRRDDLPWGEVVAFLAAWQEGGDGWRGRLAWEPGPLAGEGARRRRGGAARRGRWSTSDPRAAAPGFLVIGAAIAIGTATFQAREAAFVANLAQADGVVERVERLTGGKKGGVRWRVQARFEAPAPGDPSPGSVEAAPPPPRTWWAVQDLAQPPAAGRPVRVLYDRRDPGGTGRLDGRAGTGLGVVTPYGVAAVLLLLGAAFLLLPGAGGRRRGG